MNQPNFFLLYEDLEVVVSTVCKSLNSNNFSKRLMQKFMIIIKFCDNKWLVTLFSSLSSFLVLIVKKKYCMLLYLNGTKLSDRSPTLPWCHTSRFLLNSLTVSSRVVLPATDYGCY